MPLIWRILDQQPVRSLREYREMGGGAAVLAARRATPDEIIGLLSASGLRGRGGGGFPTGTKWETVAAARSERRATTVVVNAAEGEPGTFKDRALLRTNPYRVLEGALVAAIVMQTEEIRIGIKGTFDREINRLSDAIAQMREAGWLDHLDVQLVLGPSAYLFGEETALLEVIEGRQPFPRVTPPYRRGLQPDDTRSAGGVSLATTGGDDEPPALIDNVETLANVPLIVDFGPEWFRELGTDRSPGSIVCTVTGATRRSAVGEVAMGTTLREVIDLVGWGPQRGHAVQVVLAGTANALIPADRLDTPLTYEAMRDAGSGLGSAGFIVFDDTADPVAIAAGVARFLSVESCGQCEHCKSDGLDIAAKLRQALRPTSAALDTPAFRRRVTTVAIGARCNLAQQQASITGSLLDLFPGAVRARARGNRGATEPVTIAPIEDLVAGRAALDTTQLTKRPDWSYGGRDSGATPAARLGNTPVHISTPSQSRTWPEWTAGLSIEHPLEIVDEVHDAIEVLIDRALASDEDELDDRIDAVAVAIRTHVDVTNRVLLPMVRRVGDDDGDRLADAAEAQSRELLRLVSDVDRFNGPRCLPDIGVAMHEHAAIGDQLLALLRSELDPVERSSLADGLAAAQATSTVSRLNRSAARGALPVADDPLPGVASPARVEAEAAGDATADVGDDARRDAFGVEPVAAAALLRTARGAAVVRRGDNRTARRFVVGVDGSVAAAAALGWAARLAARVDAEILVANVFEPEQAEIAPHEYEKLVADAGRRLVTEWSIPLQGTGVQHRGLQLTGAPDRLLRAAHEVRAQLLAVGTRGAGRHAGLHVGSLAHHLAYDTLGPLAIVPLAGAAARFDRIVVGVDGSAGSAAAVRWCADIAAAAGADVVAVCAFVPNQRWRLGGDERRWRATAEAAISSEWIAPLRAAGVTVRSEVVEGKHPLAALENAAVDAGVGLFVVGTRGRSDVDGRQRLGRVPLQLVHHTQLPVVLVPPTAPT